ncbi:MAG: hypothetical protein ACRDUT_21410 [Mycobacterium sp.]
MIATMVAACGGSGHETGSASSGNLSRAVSGTSGSFAALADMFPRNGADVAAGALFAQLVAATSAKTEGACLAAEGFSRAPSTLPYVDVNRFGNAIYPNMPLIEQTHSLGLTENLEPPA